MSDNAYVKAEKAHEFYKYHLEAEITKYAPSVPEIQTLAMLPKGKYCNDNYKFCPYFLMGGFCTRLNENLQAIDGMQFTTITSKQFYDSRGWSKEDIKMPDHGVAVGAYRVFKKKCSNLKQIEQLSLFAL